MGGIIEGDIDGLRISMEGIMGKAYDVGIGGEGKWWDLELMGPVIGFGSSGGEEPLMGGEMMEEGIDWVEG